MKKIMACILTLCITLSIATAGSGYRWYSASAESAEDGTVTEMAASDTSAAPAAEEPAVTDGDTEPAETEPTTPEVSTEPADAAADKTADTTADNAAAAQDNAVAAVADAATSSDTASATEEDVGSGPAWIAESAHRLYGSLDDLLPIVLINGETIHLCTTALNEVTGFTASELRDVCFALDSDALGTLDEGVTVIVSAISPTGATKDQTVFIWVGKPEDVPTAAQALGEQVQITDDDNALMETEIMVLPADYVSDGPCKPTFALTAYPELTEGMTFAVIIDGAAPQAIEGDSYTPTASGAYRFAALDAGGISKGLSNEYSVTYGDPVTPTDAAGTSATEEETAEDAEAAAAAAQEAILEKAVEVVAATVPEVPELTVRAYDYAEGTLSSVTPSFELSGAPSGSGYYYAVSANGGDSVALSGSTFAVTSGGDYTLTFYLMDADGNILDTSAEYHVIVDFTNSADNSEAWMTVGKAKLYGSLASLLRQAESGATVYLLTSTVIALTDTTALAQVTLKPDPDVFDSDSYVITSENSPDGDSVAGTTYAWVGVEDSDGATMVLASFLSATSTDYTLTITYDGASLADRWVCNTLPITLTVKNAAGTEVPGCTYQISADSGSYADFTSGSTLAAYGWDNNTTHTVQFQATVPGVPDAVIITGDEYKYSLKMDNVAPALYCKGGTDLTLSIYAADQQSGISFGDNALNAISFDGGNTWKSCFQAKTEGVCTFSLSIPQAFTFAAKTIAVRDIAGNVRVWDKETTVTKAQQTSTAVTTTTTTASRAIYHSASTYKTVTAYNGVELMVETGAMSQLTIGDQDLGLSLSRNGALGDDADPEETPAFTAGFINWKDGQDDETTDAATDDETVDTLVLTAADESATETTDGYTWTFDGSVYKKLAVSGIDYMALTVGDQVTALSTAGFTAGIRYNMYRASGLASKDFTYTIQMGRNADGTADTASMQIQVTVDGETYTLTDDQTSEFYYYNVYSGTKDMLSRPFGQGDVQETAANTRQG